MARLATRTKHHARTIHRPRNGRHHHSFLYNTVSGLKDSVIGITDSVKDNTTALLSQSLSGAKKTTKTIKRKVDRTLTKNPYTSVGMAVLGGVIIGYFLNKN